MVRLNDDELARLDELRSGVTGGRSICAVSCVSHRPTETLSTGPRPLAILSQLARAGRVTAAIALERALRDEDHGDIDNDLARLLSD